MTKSLCDCVSILSSIIHIDFEFTSIRNRMNECTYTPLPYYMIELMQVRAPVAVYGIDGRYASALYSAASKQKALDAVEKDLVSVAAQIKKDPTLASFLFEPSVNKTVSVYPRKCWPL